MGAIMQLPGQHAGMQFPPTVDTASKLTPPSCNKSVCVCALVSVYCLPPSHTAGMGGPDIRLLRGSELLV